jgi:hypothetical protein
MSKRRLLLMLLLCLLRDPRPVPPDLFLVTDHPAQGIVRHPRHAAITA